MRYACTSHRSWFRRWFCPSPLVCDIQCRTHSLIRTLAGVNGESLLQPVVGESARPAHTAVRYFCAARVSTNRTPSARDSDS